MTVLLASDETAAEKKARDDVRRRVEAELLALATILSILGDVRARIIAALLRSQSFDASRLNEMRRELDADAALLAQRLPDALIEAWRAAAEQGDVDALANARTVLGAEGIHLSQGVSIETIDFLEHSAGNIAGQLAAHLKTKVDRILTVGAGSNSATSDIADAIGSVPEGGASGSELFGKLANAIATANRTETGTLYEMARRERMATIAAESPYEMTKTWISELIPTTRDTHRIAHGQTVGVGEKFEVGGYEAEGPMDPELPAEEVVNCLCTSVIGRGERKAGR